MAKKNGGTVAAASETNGNGKPAKSDLFLAYRKARDEVRAAEAVVADLRKAESATVAEIVSHYGPGPYRIDGEFSKARKEHGGGFKFNTFDMTGVEEV